VPSHLADSKLFDFVSIDAGRTAELTLTATSLKDGGDTAFDVDSEIESAMAADVARSIEPKAVSFIDRS
jgi:hypothetical protein